MKQEASRSIILEPESQQDIRKEARLLLQRARAIGVFPTPVDALVEIAGITHCAANPSKRAA